MKALALLCCGVIALGQNFSQRGFIESGAYFFPQTTRTDSAREVSESLLRYEAFYKLPPYLRISGGFDARMDTHKQVERDWPVRFGDRTLLRPAFAVRRLSLAYERGKLTTEIGKQFIRWGKADILNPTDRFAPRDFLNVVQSGFLGVTAARVTYGGATDSIDVVWAPLFTPSRTPLIGQRWAALPEGFDFVEGVPRYPGGSQFGARWNHIASRGEWALSFYDGFNHLPSFDGRLRFPAIEVQRYFPKLRMYGGDAAIPLKWFSIKTEGGYFTSTNPKIDEYVQYVIQLERQSGEWSLVGGYAGEYVTQKRSQLDFAPDRGLSRAFLGRAGYTLGPTQSISFEAALRQTGKGAWVKSEYSRMIGKHWRATVGFTVIRGDAADFLGQYRRNSHATLALRYSF